VRVLPRAGSMFYFINIEILLNNSCYFIDIKLR